MTAATPRRIPRERVSRKILVAGIGNVFCSDDGFGVEVAQRLLAEHAVELPDGVEVVDIGIRGVHLAYQLLDGYDVLVLIDTVDRDSPAGTVHVLEHDMDGPKPPPSPDAHGMDPATMLAVLDELVQSGLGRPPGRVLVVGCDPESTHEGMGLSEPVAAAVTPAARTVIELVHELSQKEGSKS
jgi:hydrogenase maturation protease